MLQDEVLDEIHKILEEHAKFFNSILRTSFGTVSKGFQGLQLQD